MGGMVIWWVLGAGLIAVLVWAALKAGNGLDRGRESPEQILKRRYAGGEIDRETYQRMLAEIKGQGGRDGGSGLRV